MRPERTRPALGPLLVVVGIVAVWLVGRLVLQPGMDWLRGHLSPELRIGWALIVAAGTVALVAWAMSLDGMGERRRRYHAEQDHPANDREDA